MQHYRICIDVVSAYAGNFRPAGIAIEGSQHEPVGAHLVPEMVEEPCDYVNDNWNTKSPLHLSAYVMWRLNWIHPFTDGNGRTARALSYLVLCVRLGYRLPGRNTIPDQISANKSPYYRALEAADEADRQGRIDRDESTSKPWKNTSAICSPNSSWRSIRKRRASRRNRFGRRGHGGRRSNAFTNSQAERMQPPLARSACQRRSGRPRRPGSACRWPTTFGRRGDGPARSKSRSSGRHRGGRHGRGARPHEGVALKTSDSLRAGLYASDNRSAAFTCPKTLFRVVPPAKP
jgi:hypothetical protein